MAGTDVVLARGPAFEVIWAQPLAGTAGRPGRRINVFPCLTDVAVNEFYGCKVGLAGDINDYVATELQQF